MSLSDIDRRRARARGEVRVSRFAQLFYALVLPLGLSAFLMVAGAAAKAWFLVGCGMVLLAISLPWVIQAVRTRLAVNAFAADGEIYLDTSGEQLVLSPGDVTRIGILGANSLYATWTASTPHLAIDVVHPVSGKKRRYVLALVDELLLRRLRAEGFEVSSKRID